MAYRLQPTAKQQRFDNTTAYVRLTGRSNSNQHIVSASCNSTLCGLHVQFFGGESHRIAGVKHLDYRPSDICQTCLAIDLKYEKSDCIHTYATADGRCRTCGMDID